MKIVVIGDPKRKEKDLPLIRESEKFFDVCLYAPINEIRVEIEKGLTVKFYDKNLADFDHVLPVPTLTYTELFYITMRVLSEFAYLPFEPQKYLLASNEPLLFHYLRENGIKTKNFFLLTSKTPIKNIKKEIVFPCVIKQLDKEVVVTNFHTFHDVISLQKAGSPLLVWNVIKSERNIWAFITDNFITSYEKTNSSSKPIELSNELKDMAFKIKKLMECDYCVLNFLKFKDDFILNKFTFSPNFSNFEKITKENIAKILMDVLHEKIKKKKRWWHRIFEVVKK
ncbi:MAG: hypothetical protein QMD14_01930 [Candidatus Aenigmarchaeota archaeon]|nr:hypothetical protein [Candidatus Aenigmarchaeota archaeon]